MVVATRKIPEAATAIVVLAIAKKIETGAVEGMVTGTGEIGTGEIGTEAGGMIVTEIDEIVEAEAESVTGIDETVEAEAEAESVTGTGEIAAEAAIVTETRRVITAGKISMQLKYSLV